MAIKDKDQSMPNVSPTGGQPVAGSPEDLNKRAENENPRANENIRDDQQDFQDTNHDVGSEITDGEDA